MPKRTSYTATTHNRVAPQAAADSQGSGFDILTSAPA